MPTNKLWIEHTERAAWESVSALRDKLAQAEQRMARLAPPREGWVALLDELDAAKARQGLAAENYAALLRALLDRLVELEARVNASPSPVTTNVTHEVTLHSLPLRTWDRDSDPALGSLDDDERESAFLRAVSRRARLQGQEAGRTTLDGLLSAVEAKVDLLVESQEPEIPELSVDLAALCVRLEALAKRRPRG